MENEFELKIDGSVRFVLTVHERDEYSATGTLDEVTGTYEDGDIAGIEAYMDVMVKWDGCSHVWFKDGADEDAPDDNYKHLCGVSSWKAHCAVMEWAYKTLFGLIKEADPDERWE